MTLSCVRQMPEWRECPRAECAAGQLCEDGDKQPCITCWACAQQFCYIHKMPWHEGQTCEQYNAGFDESTDKWIQ